MADDDASRQDLAADRTDLAEDRTSMANERTFAGWVRTAMASVGIGLAFNALFQSMEPVWLPKVIATVFMVLGVFLVMMAERRACATAARLNTHAVKDLPHMNLRIAAWAISLATAGLIGGIWLLV